MAIRTQVGGISVHSDPLSFTASIEVLAGNTVQSFNKDEGKYVPDRHGDKQVELTLLCPVVSAYDPEGIQSGAQTIVECEWYEGTPGTGERISNNEFYHINHPDMAGFNPDFPTWSLEVTKNFEPNKPRDIYAVFAIIDRRKQQMIYIERSVTFRTTYFDLNAFALQLVDTPTHQRIDPLLVVPDANGRWMCQLKVQFMSGKKPVADADANYWWQVFDGSSWRAFTADEKRVYVEGDSTKTLLVDARFVRLMRFRCIAAKKKNGERPATPSSLEFAATTAIKVEFSKLLRVEQRQTAGMKISPKLDTKCAFQLDIYDNTTEVSDKADHLFSTRWMAKSERPGSAAVCIGSGRNVEFIPKDADMDLVYPSGVYAEVEMHAVGALLSAGGKVLTVGNKILTTSKFE